MGLKWVNLNRLSNSRFPKAVTGSGCRSSSSEREKTNPDSLWRQQVGYVKPKVARLYRTVLEGSNTLLLFQQYERCTCFKCVTWLLFI